MPSYSHLLAAGDSRRFQLAGRSPQNNNGADEQGTCEFNNVADMMVYLRRAYDHTEHDHALLEDVRLGLRGELSATSPTKGGTVRVSQTLRESEYNLVLSGDEDDVALPGDDKGILSDQIMAPHNKSLQEKNIVKSIFDQADDAGLLDLDLAEDSERGIEPIQNS